MEASERYLCDVGYGGRELAKMKELPAPGTKKSQAEKAGILSRNG